MSVPGLQEEVLGQDGKSDRHALTQAIARASRVRECSSKVEAVYVYDEKATFRTTLKRERAVCGVQLLLKRYLDIQREPSEEERAKTAKCLLGCHAEGDIVGGAVCVFEQARGLERRRACAVAASRRACWGQALSRRMLGQHRDAQL